MIFETLNVNREGAALFAELAAPPMNLLGPELVRDLVSLIQQAEADDTSQVLVFKSADPDSWPTRTPRPTSRRSSRRSSATGNMPRNWAPGRSSAPARSAGKRPRAGP